MESKIKDSKLAPLYNNTTEQIKKEDIKNKKNRL